MCVKGVKGLQFPLDQAREVCYHSGGNSHSEKLCTSGIHKKNTAQKQRCQKSPGLRLRSFMAVILRCHKCPGPDTKESVFLHANPIQFRAFQNKKIKNVDFSNEKKQYVSSSRLQKKPQELPSTQGQQIVKQNRKNFIKSGRKRITVFS
jgi:hypothetical protein